MECYVVTEGPDKTKPLAVFTGRRQLVEFFRDYFEDGTLLTIENVEEHIATEGYYIAISKAPLDPTTLPRDR